MDLSAPPPAAADLLAGLAAAGWETVADRRGPMGGAQVVLRGPDAELELSGDRDHWVLTLRPAGLSRGITPEVWEAHLDGHEVRDPDLAGQVAFVRDRRDEAVAAARADPGVERRLVELGAAYMRRRRLGPPPLSPPPLGPPPPGPPPLSPPPLSPPPR